MEYLIRFIVGGAVVSSFAMLGDVIRPKSFAGIFGAAPSVALASLALTWRSEGAFYTATETRSMLIGAVATGLYTWLCTRTLWAGRLSVNIVTLVGLIQWLAVAGAGWFLILRGAG